MTLGAMPLEPLDHDPPRKVVTCSLLLDGSTSPPAAHGLRAFGLPFRSIAAVPRFGCVSCPAVCVPTTRSASRSSENRDCGKRKPRPDRFDRSGLPRWRVNAAGASCARSAISGRASTHSMSACARAARWERRCNDCSNLATRARVRVLRSRIRGVGSVHLTCFDRAGAGPQNSR